MSTTSNARNERERIRMDIHRITRPQVCRETLDEARIRAVELWRAGMTEEARFVAQQVREMEKEAAQLPNALILARG